MNSTILRIFSITCLISTALVLPAQIPEKPRIQTSAKAEETAVWKKDSSLQKKTTAQQKEKATTQQKVTEKRNKKPTKIKATETRNRYNAIKTNIAYDAIGILNLGYEIQVHRKMTLDIPIMWSFWDAKREHSIRTVALQPELRWWMNDETGKGHFFGFQTNLAWFNLKWNENRYQDTGRPLMGAGLTYGYKLPLGNNWGAEFNIGLGYVNMKYNTYYNIENGALINTRLRHYWGPTRLGLSLAYRF